jgi:hypothetical protein
MITIRETFTVALNDLAKSSEEVQPVIRQHALNIAATAASDAPVRTGALKNSIGADEVDPKFWEIGDEVEYGVYQELGTSRGVPALHFLGGACETEADAYFDDVGKVLEE